MSNFEKNKRISQTFADTKQRRRNQYACVITTKVQLNKLNNSQKEHLKMLFVEAKWLYNHILNLSKSDASVDVFKLNYTELKEVKHFDKSKKLIVSSLTHLSSQMRQGVVKGVCINIANLAKAKKKGFKVGSLKFISDYTSINLKQANISYKVVGTNKIKIQGIKKPIKVNGLKQLKKFHEYELANARLIHKPSGYYISITVYTSIDTKPKVEKSKGLLGIDMGCETSFTFSNGYKEVALFEETEQIKKTYQKMRKKKKGSNNRWQCRMKLRKAYEKLNNIKDNAAKQFCSKLKPYQIIIQDEQLKTWRENRHGKKVHHSIMGRVKGRLIQDGAFVINKYAPTTKLCRYCGEQNELSESERIYECKKCGYKEDRDIHAAKNMIWFYKNIVGVGRKDIKPEALRKLIKNFFDVKNTSNCSESCD